MNTNQPQDDFPEVQKAIYGVALSLDSFLINGILYGVIQRDFLPGFLEKTAGAISPVRENRRAFAYWQVEAATERIVATCLRETFAMEPTGVGINRRRESRGSGDGRLGKIG
jgi:hypothetical protein